MLLTIQFPIADLRLFLNTDTGLLHRPNWPIPVVDVDFVRSFGAVRRRRRGGVQGWIGENEICEGNRAIRFTEIKNFLPVGETISNTRLRSRIVFRRFYFDGYAVGKFEVGLEIAAKRSKAIALEDIAAKQLLHGLLQLPVTVPNMNGAPVHCQLVNVGKPLAALYRAASAHTSFDPSTASPWWVQNCRPVALLELGPYDEIRFPFWHRDVSLLETEKENSTSPCLDLTHYFALFRGLNIPLWVLRGADYVTELREFSMLYRSRNRNYPVFEERHARMMAQLQTLRQLRIALLRIHAERECLNHVLTSIATQRIVIKRGSIPSDKLQFYLNEATRRIAKIQGDSEHHISGSGEWLAQLANELAYPGAREAAFTALRDIRKNVFRKVQDYLNQQVFVEQQIMGDKYEIGQAGAVGPHAHAHDMTFNQIWLQTKGDIDLAQLADQLALLRQKLKEEASTPEQDATVGEIASAEVAAKKDDGPTALSHLAKAGKWALDVALKIGVPIAIAALTAALGL